ncbi:MAG: hypothetical protein H6604_02660 [Flavobacteriales bacterium]|nr:hypothetical protein [Flavobacteriales bacterium]
MKKIHLKLIALLVVATLFSCNSDDDSSQISRKVKKIKTLKTVNYLSAGGSSEHYANYEYEGNRLSKVISYSINNFYEINNYRDTITFEYPNDMLVKMNNKQNIDYIYHKNNRIDSIIHEYKDLFDGTVWTNKAVYEYNKDGYKIYDYDSEKDLDIISEFKLSNNNLTYVKHQYKDGSYIIYQDFKYDDKNSPYQSEFFNLDYGIFRENKNNIISNYQIEFNIGVIYPRYTTFTSEIKYDSDNYPIEKLNYAESSVENRILVSKNFYEYY